MPADRTAARRLVAREEELAALELALDGLRAGEAGAACITGEPGIGKTALIAEALERAEARGHLTISGRAAEFESAVPLAVVVDALDPCLRAVEPGGLGLSAGELALLAPVFPALEGVPRPRPARQADERHRLRGALRALLERLAGARPLVLALDDLHWADAASIDLVCSLLHRAPDAPLLLVLAARPAQTEPRLLSAVEDAERHGRARRLEPAPLTATEAAELIGDDVEPPLRDALWRESGGNPFYLEQLAAAARRGARITAAGVPKAVSAVLADEIAGLGESGRAALQAAAVLGDPFEPELAAEVAAVPPGDGLAAIDALLAADLIRPTGSSLRLRFRHPIVRGAVYDSAGPGWRLAAHGRAAAALAAAGAGGRGAAAGAGARRHPRRRLRLRRSLGAPHRERERLARGRAAGRGATVAHRGHAR
jgi:predicted ATPase